MILISVIALIGQLLLPAAHAQAWAQQNGNPLLYAFCGKVSPQLAEQFLATAPPELLRAFQLKQAPQQAQFTACDLCVSAQAGQLLLPASPPTLQLEQAQQARVDHALSPAPAVRLVRLPQLRGPPLIS